MPITIPNGILVTPISRPLFMKCVVGDDASQLLLRSAAAKIAPKHQLN